jgi:transcription antitermination factor NusG
VGCVKAATWRGKRKEKQWAVAHRAKLYPGAEFGATSQRVIKRESVVLISKSGDGAMSEEPVWWALYTRHQHEKTVAEVLTAKGLEVFLPLYHSMRRWKDRRKIISLPLFPCYVFVRGGVNYRLPIITTPGVFMILSKGNHEAIIPEAEIEAIRSAVEDPLHVEPHPFLRCGERVRIRRGTLEGVEGILVRKKNTIRLILSVDMLALSVSVEIDAEDVEPVSAAQMESPVFRTTAEGYASAGW